MLATDEAIKDTATATELAESAVVSPPETAPSRAIHGPTLVVIGARDALFCGSPDGNPCTRDKIRAAEASYYSAAGAAGGGRHP